MDKVVLYGAGKRCKILCHILQYTDIEIVAILDSNPEKWETEIEGHLVNSPERLWDCQNINWCITISDLNALKSIRKQLVYTYKYKLKNEMSFNEVVLNAYKKNFKINKYILEHKIYSGEKEAVLFDCYNGLGLGGVETWTMGICEALINAAKERVYIISDNGVYEVPSVLENHILAININHKEQFEITTMLNIIDVIMAKLPCKIITSTTNEVMLAAYLIKCHYPNMIKVISVIHNSHESVYREYMEFKECSDLYIGVSLDIKNDMVQKGILSEKMYTMTCPFPCEKILSRNYSSIGNPICIGYAGRMDGMEHSQKRMDLLLKLLEVLEKRNVNYKFEFAGDGEVRHDMEKFVHSNNLDKRVVFLGKLKCREIAAFWKKQDICVNMADYEGRSLSIIEAMGNGVVPVVTATSGVREDISDGINGYIIPLGQYQIMADRIEYLAQHKDQLVKMGKLAHDGIYPKSLMEPHLNFWETILSKK